MNQVVLHIPHAVAVLVVWGIFARFWVVQRRLGRPDGEPQDVPLQPVLAQTSGVARRQVSRSVALRGLVALGPLLGALATGLVIYALNLGQGQAGQAAILAHVGLSVLALLLVMYKVAGIGLARLRESVTRQRVVRSGASLVLLVLWIPLLVSGVALVIFPSQASFTAYAHLIASVWWTGLLLWHLRRHLAQAVRITLAPPARLTASGARRPTGGAH